MAVTSSKPLKLAQVCRLGDPENLRLRLRQVGHPLHYLAFGHSEDAPWPAATRNQIAQRDGLLRGKITIPPIVNEKAKKLLRYSGLRTGIEGVKCFPFSG